MLPIASAADSTLFEYDRSAPFDVQTESLNSRTDVKMSGGSLQTLQGRRMDFVLVEPISKTPLRRPAVIFQHGGSQTMSTYTGEAAILAKAGVVSVIVEAPYRSTDEESKTIAKGAVLRDNAARVVASIRRTLDWLSSRPDIDPKRIAYVGHSYGGNAGGILASVEPRFKALALVGLVAKYSQHIAANQSDYWKGYRAAMTPSELAAVVDLLRSVDPDQFLPKTSGAPLLFQCARFDMDDVKVDCENAFNAAAKPKTLRWYDVEHHFANLEASLDRLQWLSSTLDVPAIRAVLKRESAKRWQ